MNLSTHFCSAVSIMCISIDSMFDTQRCRGIGLMPFAKCHDPLAGQKDAKIKNTSFTLDDSQF